MRSPLAVALMTFVLVAGCYAVDERVVPVLALTSLLHGEGACPAQAPPPEGHWVDPSTRAIIVDPAVFGVYDAILLVSERATRERFCASSVEARPLTLPGTFELPVNSPFNGTVAFDGDAFVVDGIRLAPGDSVRRGFELDERGEPVEGGMTFSHDGTWSVLEDAELAAQG